MRANVEKIDLSSLWIYEKTDKTMPETIAATRSAKNFRHDWQKSIDSFKLEVITNL
jgi:hypothetical protein